MKTKEFLIYKFNNNKIKWTCLVSLEEDYRDTKLLINVPKILNETLKRINLNYSGFFLLNVVSEKTMKEINSKIYPFKNCSDVLSISLFDDDSESSYENPIGEIYLCYFKAIKQAKKFNHSFEREFSFLFLHGLLHLLKFDHIKKLDEKIMFGIQKDILNYLKISRK